MSLSRESKGESGGDMFEGTEGINNAETGRV